MRFGFVTCVQVGLSCMQAIYEVGGKLDLAVTLRDEQAANKSGRVYLDQFCSDRDIPLLKARNINDEEVVEALERARLDWLFIIGWSQIARDRVLESPSRGVLGMHPTLLPVGRGRAAIPWAILKRLDRTGVTLFKLDSGVDTGEILDQIEIPLTPSTDATALYEEVDAAHTRLIKLAFPKLLTGSLQPRKQDEAFATEWPGRRPEDGEINLSGSVADAACLIRAVTRPYPGAFFHSKGRKIVVWKAQAVLSEDDCGTDPCLRFTDGLLRCIEWQDTDPAEVLAT